MFTLSTPAVFGFQPWPEFRFRSVFPLFPSRHSQSRLMSPALPNCPPLPTSGSILVCEPLVISFLFASAFGQFNKRRSHGEPEATCCQHPACAAAVHLL
ncbi:hypothetical protein Pcinc_039346 [Petrolisthes cinctipes]|uniref:Uncharacterized protein n=1 Tax=Petrolisthes cinctipes TaxID=88211 RepID=A0AAE1BSK2_PETCI|nr:hypothetical protein Pcinc_039346 [Petrolisthes cinctipes]